MAISSCVCTSLTAHWDGDTILFLTDANGLNVDYKIGLDGEVNRDVSFTGLNTYDRDGSGFILQTSNTTGNSAMNPLDPTTGSSPYVPASSGYTASTFVPYPYSRSDGFFWNIFGINSDPSSPGMQISGVRAFDPTLTTWTTPDAYAGEVHDPASRMPYMWNKNNPYVYSDPSGYCVWDLCIGEAFGAAELVMMATAMVGSYVAGQELKQAVNDASLKKSESEHTKDARPSTEEKHEKGQARQQQDGSPNGEKGDERRFAHRKRPPGKTGKWPPSNKGTDENSASSKKKD